MTACPGDSAAAGTMDDSEIAAAFAAGDSAGIAAAYDKYAPALYGYIHWMLRDRTGAAEALRDTFVIAATRGELPGASRLRPSLYAVARSECLHRLGTTTPAAHADEGQPADQRAEAAGQPVGDGGPEHAGPPALVRAILAGLKPPEREVIELNLGHGLHDSDLATVLGVSWSRAHAQVVKARGRLESALHALLIARTGRETCPELDRLLAGWDGQLTGQTQKSVTRHIEKCETCSAHRFGTLRPEAISGLLPMAPPPAGLRDEVLTLSSSAAPDAVAHRQKIVRHVESAGSARFPRAIRPGKVASIRGNPGVAMAVVAVVLWVAAAVGVTLLVFVRAVR
jgi:DNA-directed RNA polymerase specialized sigma24 family protein